MKDKYFPDDLVAKDDEELKEEFKCYISKATSLALVEKNYIEYMYPKSDFEEFPTTRSVKRDIIADLTEFQKQSMFDFKDLDAWKVRENITE